MRLLLKAFALYAASNFEAVFAQEEEEEEEAAADAAPEHENPPPAPPVEPPAPPPPPPVATTTTTTFPETEDDRNRRLAQEATDAAAKQRFELSHELCMAAVAGDVAWVKRMLAAGADPNYAPNTEGWAAVHSAIISGHNADSPVHETLPDILKLLIDGKADLHQTDNHGRQPLVHAVEIGDRPDIIALFKDLDLERHNPQGEQTPLQRAIDQGHHRMAEKLMEMGANMKDTLDPFWFERLKRLQHTSQIKVPEHINRRLEQHQPERGTVWGRRLFQDEMAKPAAPVREAEPAKPSGTEETLSDV